MNEAPPSNEINPPGFFVPRHPDRIAAEMIFRVVNHGLPSPEVVNKYLDQIRKNSPLGA